MIVVDLNQVLISNLMAQVRGKSDVKPNKEMIRHMVLNSLRGFNVKFGQEYGQMVLCSDASDPWRKDFFPNYKHSRKMARQDGPFDWDNIFKIITEIKEEIRDNFPYIVMYVENSEADDIIATLIKLQEDDIYLVVSGDKDFIQLHTGNVKQWSPVTKQEVNGHDPDTYIKEHVLKGDSGDGVPNVLSPDHTFTDGLRQKPLGKKRIEKMIGENMSDWNDEVKRNYQRNYKLINLKNIPEDIKDNIVDEIFKSSWGDRSKLLNYFTVNKLKTLTENIGDF